jgi:hypothetical protein
MSRIGLAPWNRIRIEIIADPQHGRKAKNSQLVEQSGRDRGKGWPL